MSLTSAEKDPHTVAAEAGGTRKALVRKLEKVNVTEALTIELIAKSQGLPPDQLPTLSAIEIKLVEPTTAGAD